MGVLYLFFVPNSSLFGITYVSYNKNIKSQNVDSASIQKVVLNSRAFNVDVVDSNDSTISAKVRCNVFGFVMKQNKDISVTTDVESGVLTISVKEPYGAAVLNNSYIELYLPNKTFDLQLNNYMAKTSVSTAAKINNLKYKTNNGNFEIKSGKVLGKLDLDFGNANFTISEGVETNNNDVDLKITTGKFYSQSKLGEINIKANKRGVVEIKECTKLTEEIKSAGGRIKIGTVGNVNVVTSDTNLYFDKINSGAVISLTGAGNVNIKEINGISTIETANGKIFVEIANSTLNLKSIHGNIIVKKAYLSTVAKNSYGDIDIQFADEAESYNTNTNSRNITTETKNGKITINGVEHINLLITGSGRANVTFNNVYGKNQMVAKDRGSLNVVVDKNAKYMLKTSAKGSVNVNLAQTTEYSGYKTNTERITYVNCLESEYNESLDAALVVTADKGNIYLVDTNFI